MGPPHPLEHLNPHFVLLGLHGLIMSELDLKPLEVGTSYGYAHITELLSFACSASLPGANRNYREQRFHLLTFHLLRGLLSLEYVSPIVWQGLCIECSYIFAIE
jgi:hypothetical protein